MAKSKSNRKSKQEAPDGEGLLVLELQAIHSAETQLAKVVPKLAKGVESEKLREMLEERVSQGERILEEVDTALEELDASPGRRKNVAAEGLINDAREHMQEIQSGPALDAVLIAGIQKTEHYCIAAWGTAKALAQAVGQKTAVRSMERALEEGKQVDEQLTTLAEKEVMPALLAQSSQEDEEVEEQPRPKKNGDSGRRTSA